MHPFPHHYAVAATAVPEGEITLRSEGIPDLPTTSPPEFDGPGGLWSPETMLVGAVADCFALTFRGIARVSRLSWVSLACEVVGSLERPERVTQFTAFHIRAEVTVPPGTNAELARRVLTRAEETCLITRSLKAPVHLEVEVSLAPQGQLEEISV